MMSASPPQGRWWRFVGVLGSFGESRPGHNMRQRMLHEYLRKFLLSPNEFIRLLEEC